MIVAVEVITALTGSYLLRLVSIKAIVLIVAHLSKILTRPTLKQSVIEATELRFSIPYLFSYFQKSSSFYPLLDWLFSYFSLLMITDIVLTDTTGVSRLETDKIHDDDETVRSDENQKSVHCSEIE